MRLLFVSALEGAPWGAAETLWHKTALAAHAGGHDVEVSVLRWPEKVAAVAELERAGITVHYRLPQERDTLPLSPRPNFVVINQPDNHGGAPWMGECARAGIPYGVVTHYTSIMEWPNDTVFGALDEGYRVACKAFFVSQGSLALTERQLGRKLENAEVVRTPYNVSYDALPAFPPTENGVRLATVARLDPEDKGHDLLFEVMARPYWQDKPVTISLYGAGPFEQAMKRQGDFWGTDKVRLEGQVDDIEKVWASHHALVLASRAEGLPAAILEAMLCGRACVVTDVGGNAELLEEGVTGYIAPYPNADALDSALQRMWQSRERLLQMGLDAAASVRSAIPKNPENVFLERILSLARE